MYLYRSKCQGRLQVSNNTIKDRFGFDRKFTRTGYMVYLLGLFTMSLGIILYNPHFDTISETIMNCLWLGSLLITDIILMSLWILAFRIKPIGYLGITTQKRTTSIWEL